MTTAAVSAEDGALYYVQVMDPGVEAALIGGGVGVVTLIGTLGAQVYGIRRTSRETAKTREQQSDQLDTTLEAQSTQLDTTLAAQREQLSATLADQREQLAATLAQQRDRTLNERFATAADRLGSDKPSAVRLAGVYAMAGLADDWPENRQTCVDILCAYLRLPHDPDPGDGAEQDKRSAYRANREVRHTIIRLIRDHLRPDVDSEKSWQRLNLDFTGVVFDGGDFSGAMFSAGIAQFGGASFSGGEVSFSGAEFSGGAVSFSGAKFSGGAVSFTGAEFSGGAVSFGHAEFSGGAVSFGGAKFSGGRVSFGGAELSGGAVDFGHAELSGGTVTFDGARYHGSKVDFSRVRDWSHPPFLRRDGTTPPGVMLPASATGTPA